MKTIIIIAHSRCPKSMQQHDDYAVDLPATTYGIT